MELNRTFDSQELNGILQNDWIQKFLATCLSITKEGVLNWCRLVERMGEDEKVRNDWIIIFKNQLQGTITELIEDTENLHQKIINKIEHLMTKLQDYCDELEVQIPLVGNTELTLNEEQLQLSKLVEEYEGRVKKKQKEVNDLRMKQQELCDSLDRKPFIIPDKPKAEHLEEIRRNIESLELIFFERLEKFETIKTEILDIVNELKLKPETLSEQKLLTLLSDENATFIYSDQNMLQLEDFHKKSRNYAEEIKEEISNLRSRLTDMWDMLEKDMKERDKFSKKYQGNSTETLRALREEIKLCEIEKKENIKVFVDRYREELEMLYQKCHCSTEQRNRLVIMESDVYNEDLLELHEREVQSWKNYYKENEVLLNTLSDYNKLMERRMELEVNVEGLNRYKNRGGQLLKEEKERNMLAKKIPVLQEQVIKLAEEFYHRYGRVFKTFGKTVEQHLEEQGIRFEEEKKKKVTVKKEKVTPAKSLTNLYQSSSMTYLLKTPTKRKLATPLSENKKTKCPEPSKATNNIKKPLMSSVKTGKMHRLSVERKKRLKLCAKRISRSKHDTSNPPAQYEEFETNLSSKENCRSTIVLNEVDAVDKRLRSPNTPRAHLQLTTAPRTAMKLNF